MTDYSVYSEDEEFDEEPVYKLRDRVSDKRIEKRERQALARKNTKKGTRSVTTVRKVDDARDARATRPREVSLIKETEE